jgi:hypothetical protein
MVGRVFSRDLVYRVFVGIGYHLLYFMESSLAACPNQRSGSHYVHRLEVWGAAGI